jgi:adenylate kinase
MDASTVLLIGLPGSGKGTQAKVLAERRGYTHFSTGELFKELRARDSAVGRLVKDAYDSGKLLPDWFADYLFEEAILNLAPEAGIVLDGYPRSVPQAEIFHKTAEWLGREYKAINLAVSEEAALERQLSRATVEDRPDSATEEKIRIRFNEYRANTEPLLAYFREKGKLADIDGELTPEGVTAAIEAALAA